MGPWPFVTRRVYQAADQSKRIWSSRHQRKGLLQRTAGEAEEVAVRLLSCLWMPGQLNWWIGTIFAVGSLLFTLASVLSLWPNLAAAWSLDSTGINAIWRCNQYLLNHTFIILRFTARITELNRFARQCAIDESRFTFDAGNATGIRCQRINACLEQTFRNWLAASISSGHR